MPLQQAFLANNGAQCGICTPGMIIASLNLPRTVPRAIPGSDPRGARWKSVPLYGLHQDFRIRRHGLPATGTSRVRSYLAAYEMETPRDLQAVLETRMSREPGVWKPFAGGTDLMVLLESGKLSRTRSF